MRTLSEKEQKFDYAKYYALKLFAPPKKLKKSIQSRQLSDPYTIPLEERDRLLECNVSEEYLGYGYLENRFGYVSTCTYMPNVTADMLDWWFVWHGQEDSRYVIWDKEDHYSVQSNKLDQLRDESIPMKQRIIDVTHKVLEDTGCGVEEIVIHFQDPKDFFTPEKLEKSNLQSVIWANGSTAVMCHTVFPNPSGKGVVLASHFWIGYNLKDGKVIRLLPEDIQVPEETIRGLALHSIKEYSHLGYMLPYLYAEKMEGKEVHLEPIITNPNNAENIKEEENTNMICNTYPDAIVDKAIELYLAEGNSDISFGSIDRALGQTDGFTYNFFLSQKALNEKCIETMGNRTIENCCEILGNTEEDIKTRLDNLFAYLDTQAVLLKRLEYGNARNLEKEVSQICETTPAYQQFSSAMTAYIQEGMEKGVFKAGNAQSRAAFIAYGLLGLRCSCADELDKLAEFQASTKMLLGL